MIGRAIQFTKELLVAKEIGVTAELDAFIMALLVLSIFISFLFTPFSYALIPVFIRIRKYSKEKADLFFTKILFCSVFLSFLCLGGIYFAADNYLPFLAGSFEGATQVLTKNILVDLSPYFFFSTLSVLLGAYLNAIKKDFLYTIYPAFPALFTILYFLALPQYEGIYQQVYGFNIGSFVGFILLAASCFKQGYIVRFNWKMDRSFRVCLQQIAPLIFAALLIAVNPMIDKKMASDLGLGSLSHLEYGTKLFSIFTGFAITGITILFYPIFSEKIAQKDFRGIVVFLKKTIKIISIPLIIGTIIVVYFSETITRLLFERGAFTNADTQIVSEIMTLYLLCLPILTIGIIGVRLVNALQYNKLVTCFSLVNLVLNCLLNLLFIKHLGLKGVALSTTVVHTINALLMWTAIAYIFKKKKVLNIPFLKTSSSKLVTAKIQN